MLVSLLLPVFVASICLFFASFLTWMVLGLHFKDWRKLPREDQFLQAIGELEISGGNYMFPGCESMAEMKTVSQTEKWKSSPHGVLTVFSDDNMGRNLALTLLYFFVVNFCLAYLATLALPAGAGFQPVFRFVATAGLIAYLSAIVQHAIWFRCRIVGHVLESIAYAAIVGAVFGLMWPAA